MAGRVILLSSTYLKVSPGASRRDEDSFVLETLHEQLWEMFGWPRCACTEQTSGRRRVEELRRGEKNMEEWVTVQGGLWFSLRHADLSILPDQPHAPRQV